MNSKLTLTLAFILFILPVAASAQGYVPLVGIPGITDNGINFNNYINALYALSISIAALLAVIKIIIAGMKWMLSDVVTSKSEAITDIRGAIFGLIVVISAVLILTVINPQLTQTQIFLETVPEPAGTPGAARTGTPVTGQGYQALNLTAASTETIAAFSQSCTAAGSVYRVEGAGTAVCYAPLPADIVSFVNNEFIGQTNLASILSRFQTTHYPRLIQNASTKSTIAANHGANGTNDVLVAVTLSPQDDWLDQANRRLMSATCDDLQRSSGQPVTLFQGNINGSNYMACVQVPIDNTAPPIGIGA
jgi:hypothetical protein